MISADVKTPGTDRALGDASLLAGKSETAMGFENDRSTPTHGQQQKCCASVAHSLGSILAKPSRPAGMPKPMAIEDRPLEYADLQFIRDLVDLFGAGRLTNDKYRRGRLAGLAVCLYGDRIEVYGPLRDETGLEVVGWFDDDLPAYGWRDEASNTLFRADPALIAHLAAEAVARGVLEVER